jgi:ribosomal-protein-alanine N-acetyltransferase
LIRRATANDSPALARLHGEAFAEPWSEAALAGLAGASGAFALMDDDGFGLVRALAGEAEILTLAVRAAARRRGLGRALVRAAVSEVRALGAESLFLEVAADNAAALALYAECGFQSVGRRNAYYRRTHERAMDALVLRKTLTPATA